MKFIIKTVFSLVIIWITCSSSIGFAEVYISAEEAAKNIFPELQEYSRENRILGNQKFEIYTALKNNEVLGWAVVLDEKGKIKPITFLVGINKQGEVLDVYVLEFRDLFGSEIKRRSFLRQFRFKSLKNPIMVGRDIDAVTQATISSRAACSAVRQALKIINDLKKNSPNA